MCVPRRCPSLALSKEFPPHAAAHKGSNRKRSLLKYAWKCFIYFYCNRPCQNNAKQSLHSMPYIECEASSERMLQSPLLLPFFSFLSLLSSLIIHIGVYVFIRSWLQFAFIWRSFRFKSFYVMRERKLFKNFDEMGNLFMILLLSILFAKNTKNFSQHPEWKRKGLSDFYDGKVLPFNLLSLTTISLWQLGNYANEEEKCFKSFAFRF